MRKHILLLAASDRSPETATFHEGTKVPYGRTKVLSNGISNACLEFAHALNRNCIDR